MRRPTSSAESPRAAKTTAPPLWNGLRHADELAPDDPVVLFNEALVMEDRGQVMNAVETWNRYLHFERDAEVAGRRPSPPGSS